MRGREEGEEEVEVKDSEIGGKEKGSGRQKRERQEMQGKEGRKGK